MDLQKLIEEKRPGQSFYLETWEVYDYRQWLLGMIKEHPSNEDLTKECEFLTNNVLTLMTPDCTLIPDENIDEFLNELLCKEKGFDIIPNNFDVEGWRFVKMMDIEVFRWEGEAYFVIKPEKEDK